MQLHYESNAIILCYQAQPFHTAPFALVAHTLYTCSDMAIGIVNEIVEVLAQLRPAVVCFLGENDTGKTSFITRLANRLLGTSVAILDVLSLTISLLMTLVKGDLLRVEFTPLKFSLGERHGEGRTRQDSRRTDR